MIGPVVAGLVDALVQLVGGEPAAERRGDRVAGRAHEEEDHRDQDEDGREDQQEPHEEVAAERAAAAICGVVGRASPVAGRPARRQSSSWMGAYLWWSDARWRAPRMRAARSVRNRLYRRASTSPW